ncbi:MAG: hypothetical protein IPJ07_20510 [Acidobacteria bacterium]|nr:hypothetical protein [Acidobacteriota bacterium]
MTGQVPIIPERTPYQAPDQPQRVGSPRFGRSWTRFIFVFQDIRGRYKSEGQFVSAAPLVSLTTGKKRSESC